MSILVIDDERTFDIDGAFHARTIKEAKDYLLSLPARKLDALFLDYDLGEDDIEGYKIRGFVHEMAQDAFYGNAWDIGVVYIHSMNVVGAKYMMDILHRYNVKRIPLPPLKVN